MAALQGAVESAAPVSRLHEHQSFSLDDFPVPSGREEEWRFTPLRKLRGLHSSPVAGGKVTVGAAVGLTEWQAGWSGEKLFSEADRAMYADKKAR